MTFSGFIINNCYFYSCSADSAGCIICNENLTLLHTTFRDCGAKSDSGVFEQRSQDFKTNNSIKFCIFSKCKAKFYGCFHSINYGGQFKIELTNFSSITSLKNVGCFEIDNYSASIQFLIVTNCQSMSTNGCILAKRINSLLIKNCIFKNCSQKTSRVNSGAVFFLCGSKKVTLIDKCFFLWNNPSNSSTISVKKDGFKASISNSFFTGEKKKEIYQNKQVIIKDSVMFAFKCSKEIIDEFIGRPNKKSIGNNEDLMCGKKNSLKNCQMTPLDAFLISCQRKQILFTKITMMM